MGSDAPKPHFPPAPGEGVSDYRAPQPRTSAGLVSPDVERRPSPRHVLFPPADDPLSPKALAAHRARHLAVHSGVAWRGSIGAAVFCIVNAAVFVEVDRVLHDRLGTQLLMTVIMVVEMIVFVLALRAWIARAKRRRPR